MHPKVVKVDVASLSGLQNMRNTNPTGRGNRQNTSRIRETAIKETALSLGAQAGLAKRAWAINNELTAQARYLDTIFDFNALILEHNVLPPVLLEGRNTLNIADLQNLRISNRTYKVYKQAHFVSVAPNWRQYLWMDYKMPEIPVSNLLPKTAAERDVWRKFVAKGWDKGMEQANNILEDNVARIKEDFAGMVLYRTLLAQNMVSAPFVSNTDLGVTGDGSELHIDDRVLRITALPALNTDSKSWRAAVTQDEKAIDKFNGMEALVKQAKIVVSSQRWQPIITPINDRKG